MSVDTAADTYLSNLFRLHIEAVEMRYPDTLKSYSSQVCLTWQSFESPLVSGTLVLYVGLGSCASDKRSTILYL